MDSLGIVVGLHRLDTYRLPLMRQLGCDCIVELNVDSIVERLVVAIVEQLVVAIGSIVEQLVVVAIGSIVVQLVVASGCIVERLVYCEEQHCHRWEILGILMGQLQLGI
jgi:hypothetical protein